MYENIYHNISIFENQMQTNYEGDWEKSCAKKRRCRESSSSESASDSESNYSTRSENDKSVKSHKSAARTSPVPLVPLDPHAWTADHIADWIKWITVQFNIVPEPDIKRFPNSGVELCEMSRSDFWVCAGSRAGGTLLAKHFALTLHSATGRETSPMLNDNEPSECTLKEAKQQQKHTKLHLISAHINLPLHNTFSIELNDVNQYKRL